MDKELYLVWHWCPDTDEGSPFQHAHSMDEALSLVSEQVKWAAQQYQETGKLWQVQIVQVPPKK